MQEAGERRAPVAREADRWASRLVPAALLLSIIGFAFLLLMGYPMDEARTRAVTVLVVFCPCALVLATPTAMMAAIGQAARKGVIIKSGEALETLGRTRLICFDKTGTLTLGRMQLHEVCAFDVTEDELLRLAAAVESCSEHPLARAVLAACKTSPLPPVTNFCTIPGRGVSALVEGQRILCSNEAGLQDAGISLSITQQETLKHLRERGYATILVASRYSCIGILALGDTLRPETKQVLSALHQHRRILLTGDHATAAAHMGKGLALDSIHSDLLPHEKVEHVQHFQQEGILVAMVGDGINDAPALRQANVGISMSHLGNDIVTEAADIALMNDELTRLPYIMRLARSTLNTIRFNITAALVINAVAVVLSLLGLLTPITGALVHNAGSLLVVLNAALLYDRSFD